MTFGMGCSAPFSLFLISSSHGAIHSSSWPLNDSWLPHVSAPAVYLLFISPLPGQGYEEHNCVYLPQPHSHSSPPVPRSGTRWSLALSLPSDCRLPARVRVGGKSPPRLTSTLQPPQSFHFPELMVRPKSNSFGWKNAVRWFPNVWEQTICIKSNRKEKETTCVPVWLLENITNLLVLPEQETPLMDLSPHIHKHTDTCHFTKL